jgi:hypothetical protein
MIDLGLPRAGISARACREIGAQSGDTVSAASRKLSRSPPRRRRPAQRLGAPRCRPAQRDPAALAVGCQ